MWEIWILKFLKETWKMSSSALDPSEVYGLLEGHQAMPLLILRMQEMQKMLLLLWMVKMDGGLNFLTTPEVAAAAVAVAAGEEVMDVVDQI